MKIGLIDIDSKMPNLALMKISAFYKAKGYDVGFYSPFAKYDKVYASKIFTYTPDYDYYPEHIIKGGTGYKNNSNTLPKKIEHVCPDYSLYSDTNYSMGFTTRGCIRRCNFCIVPKKEGSIKPNADIEEFLRHKTLVLLDNNILCHDHGLRQIEKIIDKKIKVDFNQGLDARIIASNRNVAKLLARVKYLKPIRLAMDSMGESEAVIKAVELLRQYGAKPKRFSCYILVRKNGISDALNRVEICRKLDISSFAQSYADPALNTYARSSEQINFVRWVNIKKFFSSVSFSNFTDKRNIKKDNIFYRDMFLTLK